MTNKIRSYRKQEGMTQAELSRVSGVSRTIISGLESGKITETTTLTLKKISIALKKQISDIFFADAV